MRMVSPSVTELCRLKRSSSSRPGFTSNDCVMREPPPGGVGAVAGYTVPRGEAGGVGSTRPLSDLQGKKGVRPWPNPGNSVSLPKSNHDEERRSQADVTLGEQVPSMLHAIHRFLKHHSSPSPRQEWQRLLTPHHYYYHPLYPLKTHTAEERRREERYSSSAGCSHCSSSRLDVPARRGEPWGPLPGMATSGDSGDGDESITPAGGDRVGESVENGGGDELATFMEGIEVVGRRHQ